jgi:hypothetical protein
VSAVWEEVVDVLLAAERDAPGEAVTLTPRQRDLLLDMIDGEWGPLDNKKIRRRVPDPDDDWGGTDGAH